MKLQTMSDPHMQVDHGYGRDYGHFDFPVAAPNLALLGGMGRVCDKELLDFIMHQLARFERVIYVLDKDEFYGSDLETTRRTMLDFTTKLSESAGAETPEDTSVQKLGDFHLLHRSRLDLEDITILGCTLWGKLSDPRSKTRANASRSYRPIKEFYWEEEEVERNLDLTWLASELDACANGEGPVSSTQDTSQDDSKYNSAPDPMPDVEYVEEDEGDIYNDVEMSPPPQPVDLPIVPPTEDTQQPTDDSAEKTSHTPELTPMTPKPRQGPARRVLVLTSFPPTYNETTHASWTPTNLNSDDVQELLKNWQCWALKDGADNGVSVQSPLHGSGIPLLIKHPSSIEPYKQAWPSKVFPGEGEAQTCTHGDAVGSDSDPFCPPGLAAWAFGYSRWSCDVQYDVNKPKPKPKDSYSYYGRKEKTPPSLHDLPFPWCKRVQALVRMVSSQRGQQ